MPAMDWRTSLSRVCWGMGLQELEELAYLGWRRIMVVWGWVNFWGQYLMFYTLSQPRGVITNIRQGETKCTPSLQVKILIHYSFTHSTIKDWRNFEKMKLNELGRQSSRLYTGRSPVSRHSMQSYILTNYRLRKREPLNLIALGSYKGGT